MTSQQYQTFCCSPCEQPVKALIKAGITLQTGSSQLCYSDVLLRSEENICSWHRNCSAQVLLLYFGTALQWPPKGRGRALSCDVLLSSWPLLFLTFHGLAAGRSVCSALTAVPGFAFAVFKQISFSLFQLIHSWLVSLGLGSGGISRLVSSGEECLQMLGHFQNSSRGFD